MVQVARPITERTFEFAVRIVKLCQTLGKMSAINQPLVRQLIRSGTSVGANVEEAQAGQSRADFIHKMEIALKELRETRYWLRLLVATDLVTEARLTGLIDESEELVRVMSKIVVSAKERGKSSK
ncbi:four helix bundle protein [filamentous cyanobacterium CCT1]|nr:four helix bundle protein [filamentous cyanobacterium CCT1]PSN79054.1 four helix bundle protein [filamentous cyanobacterium CCP4]